jgi:hypothetical protein
MAIQNITYADKSYINLNSSVAATNKITDADMNEIKNVVNNNATEITNLTALINTTSYNLITDGNAVKTGRKVDGKDEYVKRISLDNFPGNNTEKQWPTGIDMTNVIITNLVIMVKSGSGNWYFLPNNDTANCRAQINGDGTVRVTMFQGNFNGRNGYAEIHYYHTT